MSTVALRPLNTSLVRGEIEIDGRTLQFESVDVDVIARQVFGAIEDPELKSVIAAKVVDALAAWTGEPGTADEFERAKRELTEKLYEQETPRLAHPAPPVIDASAAPLPAPATLAEARRWVLTWEVLAEDAVFTELVAEAGRRPAPHQATEFERALVAFSFAPSAERLQAIANAPVDAPVHPLPPIPQGPPSGSATFNNTERIGVRAVVVRNAGFPDAFVYTVEAESEIFEPSIAHDEEIVIRSMDEIVPLSPSRVEVWSGHLPVVLVIDHFDPPLVQAAMEQWRAQTEAPPDAEFRFDITAARLRLRNVVLR